METAIWILWILALILFLIAPFIPTLLDKWMERMLRQELSKLEGDAYSEEEKQG